MANRIIQRAVPAAAGGARQRALLLVLSAAMLIDALEVSIVIVALPAISAQLRLPVASVQWVMSGFALGFGGMLLAGRRVAGLLGLRRSYLAALVCYAALCLVGGLAGAGPLLIATRVARGCCVGLTAPAGLAIIVGTYPAGPARSRAVAVYSACGASGFTAGLLLSGALTQVQWRWTFLFPAPVALVLLAAGWRLIPRQRPTGEPAAGPAAGPARRRLPAGPGLIRSGIGAAALNGSYWGLLLLTTFRLQDGQGWPPLLTALAILPASVPPMLAAPFSAALVRHLGPRPLILAGAVAATVGYAIAWASPPPAPYLSGLLSALLLVGLGYVGAFAALHMQAVSGVPAAAARAVTALYQACVQIGGAAVLIGLAVLIAARERPAARPAAGAAQAIAASYHPAVAVITAVSALGVAAALAGFLPRRGIAAINRPSCE